MPRGDLSHKKFNGKLYSFFKAKKTKTDAKSLAKQLKKQGSLVRVVKISSSFGKWGVYVR